MKIPKTQIIGLLTLILSAPAFAATCADADYTCANRGWLTEAQATGMVCKALQNAGIDTKNLTLDSTLDAGSKKHLRFLSELKRAMNACTKKLDNTNEVAAYFDLSLVEDSFTGCWTISNIAKTVQANQMVVYTNDKDYRAQFSEGGGHTEK